MPGHPKATLDFYEIWPGAGRIYPDEQKWVEVSNDLSWISPSQILLKFWTDNPLQKAKDIYRWAGWPDLEKFKRQRCKKTLVELHERRYKEQLEERQRKSQEQDPPPAYTDVHGNAVPGPSNAEPED